jgi:hypothetical protein
MGATESSVEGSAEAHTKRQAYRCYMIRCRLEECAGPDGQPVWRFTVQQANPDAARRSFASLEDVAAHIKVDLASCAAANKPTRPKKEKSP